MLRHLWLIFAQTVTVCIALWFVVATLKPDWLSFRPVATTSAQAGSSTVTVAQAAAPPLGSLDLAKAGSGSYSDAAKKAMPAVVNIFTAKEVKSQKHPFLNDPLFRHFFGRELNQQQQSRRASSLGSGVIVSPEGYVLTNHHVIESADEIEVLLSDGRRSTAKVVGSDPETDLAVVKVDLKGLPSIVFGRPENAKVGDVVLAIGNPFGVGQTVTMGIVSALGRSHLGINTFENFIQTDAAINPGNSGGALVDSQGNLLGVNTAIYSRSGGSLGIGFAIPSNMAKSIMEQIIATGGVTRGWIGVEIQEITPDLAESFKLPKNQGAIIAGVMKGGPADKGGIKPGDVLLEIDGKPVTDSSAMLNVIAQLAPGSAAQMKVLRENKPQDLSVTVGKRPKPTPQQQRQQRQQQEDEDE
jgi:serine protease DegQ